MRRQPSCLTCARLLHSILFQRPITCDYEMDYPSLSFLDKRIAGSGNEIEVYADWTSVSFPLCQRSCLIWQIMANNDEYNDEYLCRGFFVGFNFWSRLSFQISEFRVHCFKQVSVNMRAHLSHAVDLGTKI